MAWEAGDDVGKVFGDGVSQQRALAAPVKVAFVISHRSKSAYVGPVVVYSALDFSDHRLVADGRKQMGEASLGFQVVLYRQSVPGNLGMSDFAVYIFLEWPDPGFDRQFTDRGGFFRIEIPAGRAG